MSFVRSPTRPNIVYVIRQATLGQSSRVEIEIDPPTGWPKPQVFPGFDIDYEPMEERYIPTNGFYNTSQEPRIKGKAARNQERMAVMGKTLKQLEEKRSQHLTEILRQSMEEQNLIDGFQRRSQFGYPISLDLPPQKSMSVKKSRQIGRSNIPPQYQQQYQRQNSGRR